MPATWCRRNRDVPYEPANADVLGESHKLCFLYGPCFLRAPYAPFHVPMVLCSDGTASGNAYPSDVLHYESEGLCEGHRENHIMKLPKGTKLVANPERRENGISMPLYKFTCQGSR